MKPRTCTDTTEGPCPWLPLGGVDTCLQHTHKSAPVELGRLNRDADAPPPHPDPADVRGIDAIPAARPARAYTAAPEPAAPPTPTRFPARLWAFLTMARSRP